MAEHNNWQGGFTFDELNWEKLESKLDGMAAMGCCGGYVVSTFVDFSFNGDAATDLVCSVFA
ncbi:hypothetical protein F6P93_06290 [Escherichia coli]|nr:hypothetical protein F6P93_06290 [Escherichia coli]